MRGTARRRVRQGSRRSHGSFWAAPSPSRPTRSRTNGPRSPGSISASGSGHQRHARLRCTRFAQGRSSGCRDPGTRPASSRPWLDSRPLLRPPRRVRSHQPGGVRGHGPAILRDTPPPTQGPGRPAGTSGGHEERRLRLRDGWGPVVGLRREKTDVGDVCAIGAAVGAAVVLTLLFSEDSPTTATHVGEAILIAVGALSTLAAIGLFVLAFQEVPRLRIGEPVAEARQNPAHDVANTPLERTSGAPVSPPSFVTASSGPDGAQQALDVAQLHVRNVPKRGSSTRSRRVRPTQLPRQHNWCVRSVRLGQVVRRTPPAMSPVRISSLRRWTFPDTESASGSMSLPYSTTTSNAMRWIKTRKPQGGEPYRSDLIPWSMSLPVERTQRAIRPGTR